ncbi:MAG: amidohydrolase [Chloroflexi bacterium]|nr:amidohydrolase [Chloroflexota bacterium]MDL1943825.1 amidohydrolase [Chloroflexi bacterium CFX2]
MKLFYNANIHTLDSSNPRASAILIAGGRIIAIGGRDALERLAHGKVEKMDMRGRTILPGLTDAHIHIQHYALSLSRVDCETKTKEECLRRVAERARTLKPGEWVLGHGWQQNDWDGNFPTAAELDAVAPDNPVYLTAKSLHAAWANTFALRLANISDDTPNPKDGVIQRGAQGKATGILLETAMALVHAAVPEPAVGEIEAAIEKAQSVLWQMGVTGIHDFDRRESFMALQSLRARNKLKLRVCKNIPVESVQQANDLGLRTGFGDEWLWIGSVKAFMDGALGPRTAAMFQPYEGEPHNKGILNMDGEELFEHCRKAADVGLSMTVHAIGDRANHEVLNAFEQLRKYETQNALPRLRHRIEHVQIIHPDDAPRLAHLDVIASMQPIHATSDMHAADRYWGERSKHSYAWRTQLAHGAILAFGSDAPVESPNPFLGLYAAVTRKRADASPSAGGWYPEQKLTLAEALSAYTFGAAYAANAENRLGKLAENYHADLIVLDRDPFEIRPDDLLTLTADAVMINGEWVLSVLP